MLLGRIYICSYFLMCQNIYFINMTLRIVSLNHFIESIPMMCTIPPPEDLPSPPQLSLPGELFSPDTRHTGSAGKSRKRCRGTRPWSLPPTSHERHLCLTRPVHLLSFWCTDCMKALKYRQTSRNPFYSLIYYTSRVYTVKFPKVF